MIYKQHRELRNAIFNFSTLKKRVGLVPTMGALHKGHLSLVKKALQENDLVIISIFVNPTQFDNTTDLEKYPRTLTEDATLLKTLGENIYIYAPSAKDLYGANVLSKNYFFGGLENAMEGKFRKGHFNGVGTVLNLLFRALQPDSAYFGEKDFQQLQIVKKLVKIEKLPVKIIGCPILREPHGLAMSSRNKRLSKKLFNEATVIYNTLIWVQSNFHSKSIAQLTAEVEKIFNENSYLELEYFEIANSTTLNTAQRKRSENSYRAFIAAHAGDIRLIDNIALPKI